MKTFTLIIFSFLAINGLLYSQAVADTSKFKSLSPYYFHLEYLKEDNAMLIDVREFFEFKSKRIKGAVNMPSSGNMDVADTISRDCALFLYCTTDFRSKKAAILFYDKGFRKIYSLDGGISKWKKEGMQIDKRRVRRERAEGTDRRRSQTLTDVGASVSVSGAESVEVRGER